MTFLAHRNKGFRLAFSNGLSLSVQFGPGNYCEHHMSLRHDVPASMAVWLSEQAEIALFDSSGEFLTLGDGDTVHGYVSSDDVAHIASKVASWAAEDAADEALKLFAEDGDDHE